MTLTSPSIDEGSDYDNTAHSGDRIGNWMQTYSGSQFWPLDPRPEEIEIEDIAHALSNTCRFAGHCERFYSVAEHSVYVSRMVPPHMRLMGLLHDASETYVVDVPRPLKPSLVGYKEIENKVWEAIAARFGLSSVMPPEIKVADNAVLLAERDQIMKPEAAPWCLDGTPAPVTIECLSPQDAELLFLREFGRLN